MRTSGGEDYQGSSQQAGRPWLLRDEPSAGRSCTLAKYSGSTSPRLSRGIEAEGCTVEAKEASRAGRSSLGRGMSRKKGTGSDLVHGQRRYEECTCTIISKP